MAAAQAAGDGKTALEAAAKLQGVITAEAALAVPMVQPDMAAPYWAQALFGTPEAVLALSVPDNAPTYVKAMWHYARGVVLASTGQADEAAHEIGAIQALASEHDLTKGVSAGMPGLEL